MKMFTSLTLGLSFGFAAFLGGCAGYTALYKTETPVTVGAITVQDVEKNVGERRVAQVMRQELLRRFPASSGDTLTISLERKETALAVREDATVERSSLTLNAYVTLTDTHGDILWEDVLSISAAYGVESTPLSTDIGQKYARKTAAIALSDKIAQKIYTVYNARQAD